MNSEFSPDDIQTLSLSEAIRKRPRLYFEKCFNEQSLDSLPFEVLCHAFDEYFDAACRKIEITVFNDSFLVHYDAGISLDAKDGYEELTKAEVIMTMQFACRNEKKHLAVGEEFCSLGMAIINMAAESCELATQCKGVKGNFTFEKGILQTREITAASSEEEFTSLRVKPDPSLFEGLSFTAEGINKRATAISARLEGLTILVHNTIQPV